VLKHPKQQRIVPDSTTQLSIVRYGDPVLRRPADTVGRVTPEVRRLVGRMVAAMRAANGLGLAANQVGVSLRVAVVEGRAAEAAGREGRQGRPAVPMSDEGVIVLLDPEVVEAEGGEQSSEGCLSLPRLYGAVERPSRVVVRARDLSGKRVTIEAEGLFARALCHEVDHLNGKLFVELPPPPSAPATASGVEGRRGARRARKGAARAGGEGRALGGLDKTTLYWLLGQDEEGEPITQPTTLDDALRAFTAAKSRMVEGPALSEVEG
jgi:peptide deformylase